MWQLWRVDPLEDVTPKVWRNLQNAPNSLQHFLLKRDKLNSNVTVQEKKMFPEKSRKPMIRLYCFPGAADNYMCLIWDAHSAGDIFLSLASKKFWMVDFHVRLSIWKKEGTKLRRCWRNYEKGMGPQSQQENKGICILYIHAFWIQQKFTEQTLRSESYVHT